MVTVEGTDQHQDRCPDEAESGGRTSNNNQAVTTVDVDNVGSSADSSTPGGRGSEATAICVRSEFDVDEAGGSASFAQYSDDDSVQGEVSGLCNDFVDGDLLPAGSEVPMFGQVCVKNSSKVHFVDRMNDSPEEEDAGSDCGRRGNEAANSPDIRVHRKVRKWLFCGIGSFLLIAVVVCMILFIPKHDDPLVERIPLGPNGSPWIITRAGWDGRDRGEPGLKLKLPVPFAVISHTETKHCEKLPECKTLVRIIQTRDLDNFGWSDIGYNFLIGGDGNVYAGRGWDYVGAHTWSYNTRSVGISFVGNFSSVKPPESQLRAAQQLLELGVYEGKLASDYKLIGHRQNPASKTDSPGEVLYNIIKTWPHWVSV